MIRRKFLSVIAALPFAGLFGVPKQADLVKPYEPIDRTVTYTTPIYSDDIVKAIEERQKELAEEMYNSLENYLWETQLPINQANHA